MSVKETEFYERLGVTADASQNEIKKAYYKAAQKHHPDRGGSEEKFKEISEAYEILSDPEKREMYNKYGKESLSGAGFHASDPFDFFRSFSGGAGGGGGIFDHFFGGGGGRSQGPKKTKNIEHAIEVPLSELYCGKQRKMKVSRKKVCEDCEGSGSTEGKGSSFNGKCTECSGSGRVMKVLRQGNTIYQTQAVCDTCQGKCFVIPEDKKCPTCSGQRVRRDTRVFTVDIEAGAKWGDKIDFFGESNQEPGAQTGDLVFHLRPPKRNESIFTRKGSDLQMDYDITLVEALTGFNIQITHLDKSTFVIANKLGDIISPGETVKITDKGFSIKNQPSRFGDLYITFNVVFPKSLSSPECSQLKKILPSPPSRGVTGGNQEVCYAHKDSASSAGASGYGQSSREAYEEDERGQGNGGVECQTQQQ